jgi:antitoxin HicB
MLGLRVQFPPEAWLYFLRAFNHYFLKNKALNFVYIYNILGENNMKYRVIIEQDEDGIFVAECPTLPGAISQGKTREEAIINITDAIKGYLESLKKANEPIPSPISEEIIDIYG